MNASLHNHEIRFAPLTEALRQESQTGPTDATKSIRVRHGIHSLRGQAGRYIVRDQKFITRRLEQTKQQTTITSKTDRTTGSFLQNISKK